MSSEVWGNLAKSQTDSEKIEEAIARLILEHCADETAHLGVGQSLQSHKASEIIDHLAESIVSDKILNFNVLPTHMSTDKIQVWPSFEALDCWGTSGGGTATLYLGGIHLQAATPSGTYKKIYGATDIFDLDLGVKNPVFEAVVRVTGASGHLAYFGLGSNQTEGFGFKILNGVLYAFVTWAETIYLTEIVGADVSGWHSYRAVSTSGVKVEYYLDEVLVHTETENLPQSGEYLSSLFFRIQCNSVSIANMYISNARFIYDK